MSDKITILINGNSYQVSAADEVTLSQISHDDREKLLQLLESLKHHEQKTSQKIEKVMQATAANSGQSNQGQLQQKAENPSPYANIKVPPPERLGKGDIDNLMEKLIMEEKKNKKPPLDARKIYTWAGVVLIAFALLVYIF